MSKAILKGGASRGSERLSLALDEANCATGMRHVQEEEDQVRWKDAQMFALRELQDRMHIYPGREEETTSERVRQPIAVESYVLRLAGRNTSKVSRIGWAGWNPSCECLDCLRKTTAEGLTWGLWRDG